MSGRSSIRANGKAPDDDPLPAEGAGADGALARFAERWAPGFSGSAGPATSAS
ncbi:hypothetical protein [Streptomyces sp. AC555_RSS877]|uniref:hypothetical protein n=1 Tax=Streptomyces sp. AC555_RSS877 TaxID=2823688 RepID=UPI001C27D6AF|nr:hypothetical protein [Streptomyces sp. AC555_RSS877]